MSEEYILRINDEHRKVIEEALDLYSRVLMGQWEIVAEKLMYTNLETPQVHRFKEILDVAKREILDFGPGASHGIHHPDIDDSARVAFDLKQLLRNEAYQRRPEPKQHYTVDAYEPLKSSTKVPMAKIDPPDYKYLYKLYRCEALTHQRDLLVGEFTDTSGPRVTIPQDLIEYAQKKFKPEEYVSITRQRLPDGKVQDIYLRPVERLGAAL